MILVDTTVWVDHLRSNNKLLISLLDVGAVLIHPFVIGELALGNLGHRKIILASLSDLPHANVAIDAEVLSLIDRYKLFGQGIGYVDAHLLAAVKLTPSTHLWTNDKKLHSVANELGLAMKQIRRN